MNAKDILDLKVMVLNNEIGGFKSSTKYDGFGSSDIWGDDNWGTSKWHKEYLNEYTITMDICLQENPPREGISLFQTALIHAKENKRSGKVTLTRSEGECVINQAGGVGQLGTFGENIFYLSFE